MSAAVLFGLLSALGFGGTDFVAPLVSRSLGIARAMFYSQASALVVISLWLLVDPSRDDILTHASFGAWAAGVGSSVLILLATAALFQGLTHGTLAVVVPVTASYGAVSALLAALSGEAMSAPTVVGIAVTVAGVVLTSAPSRGPNAVPLGAGKTSGFVWALAAALGYGVGFWFQGRAAVPSLGSVITVWVYYAAGVAGLACLSGPLRQSLAWPERTHLGSVLGLGMLSVLGNAAMALGLATGRTAVVTVLSSLAAAVTVLLARVLLNHPVASHQWAGLASIIGGLALIHASG